MSLQHSFAVKLYKSSRNFDCKTSFSLSIDCCLLHFHPRDVDFWFPWLTNLQVTFCYVSMYCGFRCLVLLNRVLKLRHSFLVSFLIALFLMSRTAFFELTSTPRYDPSSLCSKTLTLQLTVVVIIFSALAKSKISFWCRVKRSLIYIG